MVIEMARNRRNKRNSGPRIFDYIDRKTFFIIFVILVGIIIALLYISFRSTNEMNRLAKQTEELNDRFQQIYQASDEETGTQTETEEEKEETIELTILGDIFCTTDQISDSYDATNYRYDFRKMFQNIESVVKQADLAMGTVETNFTKQDYTSGTKYNSPTEFADALADMGLDVVNIGTEHANDYGAEGLTETKEYWKNKGVTVVGDTLEENNVRIYQVKEFKIAFLSYIQSGLITSGQENVSVYQRETAKEEIAYAKQNADFVIVWMHWSSINQSFASTNETELADELVELGADMIIGNHSNYVQQMEVKKNSEGKNVFVAYSLGNYLLNTNDTHTQVELILKVELRKSKEDGKVYLQQVDYVPIYAMDYGTTAKPRYEYLDLRTKLESYESIPTQEEEKVRYQQMKDALEWIEEVVVGG